MAWSISIKSSRLAGRKHFLILNFAVVGHGKTSSQVASRILGFGAGIQHHVFRGVLPLYHMAITTAIR
jgi:hypothetical protein